ncbi:MAG: nitrate reductase [Fuerstiella sp.]
MSLLNLIHQKDGPYTRQLLRQPGGFGLGQVPVSSKPDGTSQMVCGYCSTGCSLNIHLKDHQAISLTPSTDSPVNVGMACPKGWEALNVLDSDDRATTPLLRNPSTQQLDPIDWSQAADVFVDRIQAIQQQHGNDSVAFLGTGQLPTEELAFLGALAKFGMGMVHGDGNTRQCMATAVTAYKESFGFDAPPYTYQDFEESDVIVLVGSNLCIAHPIMWERVMKNRDANTVVVIDPRTTETAAQSDLHLPLQPKSDLLLMYGIAAILIRENWIDESYIQKHTSGFDAFKLFVSELSLADIAAESGLDEEQIYAIAKLIHEGKRVSFWWTMGVNQSHQGTRTAQAIINLALMTGNIGRPGTGANSVTGQCNAMGSRLFSNTTNLMGGHKFDDAADREKVAALLNIDASKIPDRNSWSYDRIVDGIEEGKIRALWIVCTNPAHSWIQQDRFRKLAAKLDFLVVQDMYCSTETAVIADLVLPAAGWGEKEGSLINSERRWNIIKQVRRAPGKALSDFNIFRLLADRWGCSEMFSEWTSPEAVFQILKRCSQGRPCDITGIEDYKMIDDRHGVQWPFTATEAKRTDADVAQRRLFEDGRYFHKDGRAKFVFEPKAEVLEPPCEKFPLTLLTGRGSASQWHTQTRTSKSAVLRKLSVMDAFVEVNPVDAKSRRIEQGQMIWLSTRRGQMQLRVVITKSVQQGAVFVAMHYDQINKLTLSSFDPYSRQPSYKHCAAQLTVSQPEPV